MAVALKTNLETLTRRGMTQNFIDRLDSSLSSIIAKNSEQERLKAALKTITADIDGLLRNLNADMSEAVKVVKLEMPKEKWKGFGIQAKR